MTKQAKIILVGLLLIILITSTVAYAWSDDFGPWGKKGHHHRGPHGVAEPVAIALIGIGLAGLGAYALKRRKKN
jgi:LPXTG-motif cell wall-anchored protein